MFVVIQEAEKAAIMKLEDSPNDESTQHDDKKKNHNVDYGIVKKLEPGRVYGFQLMMQNTLALLGASLLSLLECGRDAVMVLLGSGIWR